MRRDRFSTIALCVVAVSALFRAPAGAQTFTAIGPPAPGENSHAQILGFVYGGAFTRSGSVDFVNGSGVTAKRIEDNLFGPEVGGDDDTDQTWKALFQSAEAQARWATYPQTFGYFEGTAATGGTGSPYRPLFTVTGSGNLGFAPVVPLGDLPRKSNRWGRGGGPDFPGPPRGSGGAREFSSQNIDNPGGGDHMVSYQITGSSATQGNVWLLFWEDILRDEPFADLDFNDLAVEIRANPPPARRWIRQTSGTWGNPTNWGEGFVPNDPTAEANFLGDITGNATITLTTTITINKMLLLSSNRYTFTGQPLTFAAPEGTTSITAEFGSHTFLNTVRFNANGGSAGMTLEVTRPADVLTFAGNFTITGTNEVSITKTGRGRVDLPRLQAPERLLLEVDRGTLRFRSDGGTSRVDELLLSVRPDTKIDLTNNALILDYDGGSPLTAIASHVARGYNGGSWNGGGIISSHANNTTYGVGYAEAASVLTYSGSPPMAPFLDEFVDETAVLVVVARYGDADLDGAVDLQDFNRLAANFGKQDTAVWSEGDFNYDRDVGLADFNRLANQFGQALHRPGGPTPRDWANLAVVIPEPASAALLAAAAALPLRRLRRKNAHR